VYGFSSAAPHGGTLSQVIPRRVSSVIDPSVSPSDLESSSADSVASTELEDSFAGSQKLPDISTNTFDYQESDRAIALVDPPSENPASVPSDEDHIVASSEPYFPSASLPDCVPDAVPSVVPVLNPLPRVSSQLSLSSVASDTELLGLLQDDSPPDASGNQAIADFSLALDLTSGPVL
ncbi:hypothetical protein PICMEDRAFT_73649, partial [Pichia membranifaciens NRRL Y-2026]